MHNPEAISVAVDTAWPRSAEICVSYNNDLNQAFEAVEKATWLSKEEYVEYVRSLHEYESERSECFSALVEVIKQPDEDISSSWASARSLGAIAMGHLKDTVPHLQSDSELGLQEWASREMQLFESLRAEQFLRARKSLIVMRKETVEATKTLAETWRAFDETNSALNAELVKSSTEFKNKLTEWAVMAGNGADLLGQVIGGGSAALSSVLTVIKNVGKNAKELRPVLEAAHMKMQAKQPEWDVLKKLNDSQKEVLERIDPSLIERHLNEARFDDVSASQDFQQFRDGAMQALAEHAKAALSASEEYHSAAAGKFADRSSSTMEKITQLDELGRRWKEFDEIQRSLGDGALKSMVRRKTYIAVPCFAP